MNNYEIGNVIRLTGNFYQFGGGLFDPSSLLLRIKAPDSTVTVIDGSQLTKVIPGSYYYDYAAPLAGRYFYRFEGSGNMTCAAERQFTINPSRVLC